MKKKTIIILFCAILILVIGSIIVIGGKGGFMKPIKETIFFHENIESISFANDLGITNIGDPFMLKISENEYYMYCTSASNGFYCWRSEDMVNWGEKKMCYVREMDSWGVDCFWAPEVVSYEGKYYMFYTAKNHNGSLRIGLAIADKPEGPFVDYKNEPLFDFGYAAIDANVLIDDDGSKYLYYSRDCSENMVDGIHTSQIYVVQLADDMKSTVGEAFFLTTPDLKWERIAGNYMWNEGPEVIKHNDTYYLSYSGDYFESPGYSVGYATSNSPMGPFTKPDNNRILHSIGIKDVSGPGHHSFVLSPDDSELWIAYHSHTSVIAPSGNRKVNIAKAGFSEDGRLYINGPLTSAQPLPSGSRTTNVTGFFKAMVNDEEITKLTDGMIQVHSTPDNTAFIPVNEKRTVTVSLKSDSEFHISSVALYAGHKNLDAIASVRLCINGNDYSEEYLVNEETTSPIMLSFDPVSAKTIDIIITAAEGKEEIPLSEIELFTIK